MQPRGGERDRADDADLTDHREFVTVRGQAVEQFGRELDQPVVRAQLGQQRGMPEARPDVLGATLPTQHLGDLVARISTRAHTEQGRAGDTDHAFAAVLGRATEK